MPKAGTTLFLMLAFFALAGAINKTQAFAFQNTSSCSSQLVSTPLCEEIESQTCNKSLASEEPKQIQAAVIIASPSIQDRSGSGQQTSETVNPVALPTDASLDSNKIFDLVSQYRESQGLSLLERDEKVCELAQARSAELVQEVNSGTVHSGLYARNMPYWIFENAKVGSDEEGTVSWWLSSPLHRESIVGDYKFSCVKCTGNHCSQLFTSFSPK